MAEEHTGVDPFQRMVLGLRSRVNLAVATAIVSFHLVIGLSAWVVKDMLRPGAIGLILVPMVLFGEFAFCVYSAIIFITSDPLPTTKLKARLIWWHGCGVILLAVVAVSGALVMFMFSAAFSGVTSVNYLSKIVYPMRGVFP